MIKPKPGTFVRNKNRYNGDIFAIVLPDNGVYPGWVTVRCNNGVKNRWPKEACEVLSEAR